VVVDFSPDFEWFTPDWKVTVNGKKQPVLRVNEWQNGVPLPVGKNRSRVRIFPYVVSGLDGIESNHNHIAAGFCDFCGCPKSPG
jgi:hypothetical protein